MVTACLSLPVLVAANAVSLMGNVVAVIDFGIAMVPPFPIMICILLATGLSGAAPVEALVRQERTPE